MFKLIWLTIRRLVFLAALVICLGIVISPNLLAQEKPTFILAQNTSESGKQVPSETPTSSNTSSKFDTTATSTPKVTSTQSARRSDKPRGPEDPYADYYEAYRKFNDEVYGKKG